MPKRLCNFFTIVAYSNCATATIYNDDDDDDILRGNVIHKSKLTTPKNEGSRECYHLLLSPLVYLFVVIAC